MKVILTICFLFVLSFVSSGKAVAQMTSDDLAKIKVFPNPWQPNSGGRSGSASRPCGTGVIIDGITSTVKLRIYSLSGDLVFDRTTTPESKCVAWNGKNSSGVDVASGVYIVIITDETSQNKVIKKIAIIR